MRRIAVDRNAAGRIAPTRASAVSTPAAEAGKVKIKERERSVHIRGSHLEIATLDCGALGSKWRPSQVVRVWTPPGHNRDVHGELPVIFLNDGQNLFDDKLSFSGSSWRASDAALRLMEDNSLPMAMIVGIDHAEKDRSLYYCPYKPGTGVGDFRPEAELWKGGKVNEYLDFVVEDLVGVINREYGSSMDPNQMIFGGSSFGGICTLCMSMRYPEQFGGVIVESPSYWMGEGKFLEDLRDYTGAWPERMFLASGKQEYTGTRKNGMDEVDDLLNRYFEESVDILAQQGLVGDRIHTWLEEGGAHTESAWARRLPAALRFLGTPLQARRRRDRLYFTMPQTLQAGEPMTLYFNPKASGSLAGEAELELRSAFNMWGVQPQDTDLQRYQPFPVSDPEHEWMAATVAVPEDAWEMNFVFKARGRELWEDNAGANFRRVVRGSRDDTNEEQIEAARAAARAAADGPADDAAHRNRGKLLFTTPKSPVAGEPLAVYMNRAASLVGLKNSPNVKLHYSFNDWAHGKKDQSLLPTSLWRDEGTDWWGCKIEVPSDAFEFNLCFSDGGHVWESNNGNNWNIRVRSVEAASRPPARQIEHTDVNDHAGGKLHIIRLTKREGRGSRRAKWTEEKTLRVWTPGGYDRNNLPPGGMPVLYFCDGQNLFEDWLAHQGVSWRAGFAAAHLIGVGAVPPFVICAIDGAGPYRSYQYLPWPPGEGAGGFRGDAERWPGGGVDDFLERVIHEIMPLVTEEFGTATAPDKVAFAGGSFGGIAALYAGLKYPDVFGSVLAESPSLWSAEGRFLHEMGIHLGQMPERVWLAVGTHEYSATRDHDRPEIDELLLHYGQECARILQEKGCHGDRLGFQIEQDAGHHEGAWAYRLQGALHYLLAPWWDHYR